MNTTTVAQVDDIVNEYLNWRYDETRPESPPLKNVVFRKMSTDEWEKVQSGEPSGAFWSSDPTEYGRHAIGKLGEVNNRAVLVVARHDPSTGQIYRGLVRTPEEASKAHFQSTTSHGISDVIAVYRWNGRKLERIATMVAEDTAPDGLSDYSESDYPELVNSRYVVAPKKKHSKSNPSIGSIR